MEDLIKIYTGALIYIVALLGGLYFRQPMWLFVCAFLLIVAIYEWGRLSTHAHHPKKTILTSAIVLFIFLQFGLFFSKFAYGPTWNNISILSGIIYYLFRSEEHTSELQSRGHLVCRLLLEKKKKQKRS